MADVVFLPKYSPQLLTAQTRRLRAQYARVRANLEREWRAALRDPSGASRASRARALLDQLDSDLTSLRDQALQWINETYPGMYATGAQSMAGQLGPASLGFSWTQAHMGAVQILAANTETTLLRATEFVSGRAKRELSLLARDVALESVLTGRTAVSAGGDLARQMMARGVFSVQYANGANVPADVYAEMAIRSRTAIAYNAGGLNQGKADGVEFYEISDGLDCGLETHDSENKAAGQIVSADVASMFPISHPNAVMAGSLVLPLGDVEAGYRAEWSGPVVRVCTVGGRRLTIGPNHPVLTGRGWLAAKLLRVGDHVIGGAVEDAVRRPSDTNLDHVQLVEDAFEALRSVGAHSRVVPATDDFHGDGNYCQGKVDVVATDRSLARVLDAARRQERGEPIFEVAGSQLRALTGVGARFDGAVSVDLASPRSMSSVDVRRVVVAAAQRDATFGEPLADDLVADAERLADLAQRVPFAVQLDRVLDIEYGTFRGHAFDFSTSSRAYWCDGVLVHNCVRSFLPRPDVTAADVAAGAVESLIDPARAADQRAFELFARQEAAARGATLRQSAARFGRMERTTRVSRAPRAPRQSRKAG